MISPDSLREDSGMGMMTVIIMIAVIVILAAQSANFMRNFLDAQRRVEAQEDLVSIRQFLNLAIDCAQSNVANVQVCCNSPQLVPVSLVSSTGNSDILQEPNPNTGVLATAFGRRNQVHVAAFCSSASTQYTLVYLVQGVPTSNPEDFVVQANGAILGANLYPGDIGFGCQITCP